MWLCEIAPCDADGKLSLCVSPQLTFTVQGLSAVPGSLKEPRLKDLFSPSLELWPEGAVTVGATLLTVTETVYSVNPLSLSRMRARTVFEAGPSGKVQDVEALVPL